MGWRVTTSLGRVFPFFEEMAYMQYACIAHPIDSAD
jgi:hypothetical protein